MSSANCTVEFVKLVLSYAAICKVWKVEGVHENNRVYVSWSEVVVYAVPAALYQAKNILQYVIILYLDPPSYQVLKNMNIITTGILYRIIFKKAMSWGQWFALLLLAFGCMLAQLKEGSRFESTSPVGLWLAIAMALLSSAAGVYTEVILKARPRRNVNVQNIYLYFFGIVFNFCAWFCR